MIMALADEIELRSIQINGVRNLRQGNYRPAEDFFRKQYEMMCRLQQDLNRRLHKGAPLHNLGISLLFQGKSTDGIRYLILAYIEDLISTKDKLDADENPASRVLRGLCGAVWEDLDPFYDVVEKLKVSEKDLRAPEKVYDIGIDSANLIINHYRKFLQDTWKLEVDGQRAIQERKFESALAAYLAWYKALTLYQKERGKEVHVHKGHVLANIGFIYAQLDPRESMKYYLLAYIEDILSERKEGRARFTSAFQALTKGFGFSEERIASIEKLVRQGVIEGRDQSLPENELEIIEKSGVVKKEQAKEIDKTDLESSTETPAPKKSIDKLPGSYTNRVFVGGSSADENTLRQIGDYLENLGLTPIIALDYERPHDERSTLLLNYHDLDILLFHNCRWAIFELSTPASQLEEITWSIRIFNKETYGVKTVRSPKLSDHIHDLFKELGGKCAKIFMYRENSELEKYLKEVFA